MFNEKNVRRQHVLRQKGSGTKRPETKHPKRQNVRRQTSMGQNVLRGQTILRDKPSWDNTSSCDIFQIPILSLKKCFFNTKICWAWRENLPNRWPSSIFTRENLQKLFTTVDRIPFCVTEPDTTRCSLQLNCSQSKGKQFASRCGQFYSQSPGECEKKKTASYHCTKSNCGYSGSGNQHDCQDIAPSAYSTSNMPTETARLEERKMIQTIVGRVSTVKMGPQAIQRHICW